MTLDFVKALNSILYLFRKYLNGRVSVLFYIKAHSLLLSHKWLNDFFK